MIKVALLLPEDYQLSSVANILEVFEAANTIHKKHCGEDRFKIQIIQQYQKQRNEVSQFHERTIKTTRSTTIYNLVLIPALKRENLKLSVQKNSTFVPWIQNQFKDGAEIASFCSGAYLFAETSLLNGRLATTHVDVCPDFILTYPLVFVKPGRTLTVDWNCYTGGGATSSFHLIIYLIQKFCGNEVAIKISKEFSIELDRFHQSYFSTFRPIYSHSDELVKSIQNNLEENYLSIRTIEDVTKKYPSSRRNLVRRFIKETGLPPIEYLQNIRIAKAKQLLENTSSSVSEIISQTGYTDPKSFRKIFLKLVGIPPLAYREKFTLG